MTGSPGYALRCKGQYTLSLTTSPARPDGTQEFLLHSVGADTHIHTRVKLSSTGITEGGVTLKDSGQHLGSDRTFEGATTEPFARAHVIWDEPRNRVTCELANPVGGSALTAAPTAARQRSSRDPQWHDLPWPNGAHAVHYEFRYYDAANPPSISSTDARSAVLPFGGGSRLGVVVTAIPSV